MDVRAADSWAWIPRPPCGHLSYPSRPTFTLDSSHCVLTVLVLRMCVLYGTYVQGQRDSPLRCSSVLKPAPSSSPSTVLLFSPSSHRFNCYELVRTLPVACHSNYTHPQPSPITFINIRAVRTPIDVIAYLIASIRKQTSPFSTVQSSTLHSQVSILFFSHSYTLIPLRLLSSIASSFAKEEAQTTVSPATPHPQQPLDHIISAGLESSCDHHWTFHSFGPISRNQLICRNGENNAAVAFSVTSSLALFDTSRSTNQMLTSPPCVSDADSQGQRQGPRRPRRWYRRSPGASSSLLCKDWPCQYGPQKDKEERRR